MLEGNMSRFMELEAGKVEEIKTKVKKGIIFEEIPCLVYENKYDTEDYVKFGDNEKLIKCNESEAIGFIDGMVDINYRRGRYFAPIDLIGIRITVLPRNNDEKLGTEKIINGIKHIKINNLEYLVCGIYE